MVEIIQLEQWSLTVSYLIMLILLRIYFVEVITAVTLTKSRLVTAYVYVGRYIELWIWTLLKTTLAAQKVESNNEKQK